MTIRFKLPPGGDVPATVAARRMGLALENFRATLPGLLARGFPPPDPTTGNFDLDAIDVWRRARYPHLSTLTPPSPLRDASAVVLERVARMRSG